MPFFSVEPYVGISISNGRKTSSQKENKQTHDTIFVEWFNQINFLAVENSDQPSAAAVIAISKNDSGGSTSSLYAYSKQMHFHFNQVPFVLPN